MTEPANSLFELCSASPEETRAIGRNIAPLLEAGSVISLEGGLGSGKTELAKGIAQGLGIAEEITSPTYAIISEYPGPLPLYHMDAYRLKGPDDFIGAGAGELLSGGGICIIEWGGIVRELLPGNTIFISIEIIDHDKRKITIQGLEPGAFSL